MVRRGTIILAVLLQFALAAPAFAVASCTDNSPTSDVILTGDSGELTVSGTSILFNTVQCGETGSTETISVKGSADSDFLTIDLSGGLFQGPTEEIDFVIDLEGGADIVTVIGSAGDDDISLGTSGINLNGDADGDGTLTNVENVVLQGGLGADSLHGDAAIAADTPFPIPLLLVGEAGQDDLVGGSSDDKLDGGTSSDTIAGGAGDDELDMSGAPNGVEVDLSNQIATGWGSDQVSQIEDVSGTSDDDILIGNSSSNDLFAGAGGDRLAGRNGSDDLSGGPGRDTADFASSGQRVRVDLSTNQALGEGTDDLLGIEDVTGSRFGDTLEGNGQRNLLLGKAGGDILVGGGDNDRLEGGPGSDVASFADSPSKVRVDLGSRESTGWGRDRLVAIEGASGSRFSDRLVGDGGGNRLSGRNGKDLLDGRSGNDRLDGGDGNDTIDFSDSPSGIKASVSGNARGWGTDRLIAAESIIGTRRSDVLIGSGVDNTLVGGDGGDHFDGRAGSDRLFGGQGIDSVSFGGSPNRVAVNLAKGSALGWGRDRLLGLEDVRGSRHSDFLTGNGRANALVGLGGNDRLNGVAGNDRLIGVGGRDRLLGMDGNDVLVGGGNADALVGGAGTDRLTSGGGNDKLFGAEGDDSLIAGGGNDVLRGGIGDDRLSGGFGADDLFGDAGDDSLVGGGARDLLRGGPGNDGLAGGSGTDTCHQEAGAGGESSCELPKPPQPPKPPDDGPQCTPGYSPCLPPASDYDCAGGSGNGPKYVEGPVTVSGSDPYDLDSDGDGVGCED